MAVLVEAISVIVRKKAIDERYEGSWEAFMADLPNKTYCTDGEIVRVGFMSPEDVEVFVKNLESKGLRFIVDEESIDIAVVDQLYGPTCKCKWLGYGKLDYGVSGQVATCWLCQDNNLSYQLTNGEDIQDNRMAKFSIELSTPDGWQYEGSLSQEFIFVSLKRKNECMKYLRMEGNLEVYLDKETGKEVYMGRTNVNMRHFQGNN